MYHEDISNNYTSQTYPEFSQTIEGSKDISNSSSYNPKLVDNNQYNQYNFNNMPPNPHQNFNFNHFNHPQNQSLQASNFNQPNQYNQFNQNQFNNYQGQYNDNFYQQDQNFEQNNYQNNYNSFYPPPHQQQHQPYSGGHPPPNINQGKFNYNQQFSNFGQSDSRQSYYSGYADDQLDDRDERRRDNMRGSRGDHGNRDYNEDWRGGRRGDDDTENYDDRRQNDSDQESDTSYDSDTGATKTVYINNVYQKWTEKDIENSIKKHGIVVKAVRIIPRKKAGAGRSFAFADFYKVSEAEKWMDVTQSRLLFPDETIAYLEYSEQCRNKAITKRRNRGEHERTPPKRGREGDWSCNKCDFWNFKWRDNCFRCSNTKSGTRSRSRSCSEDEDSQQSGSGGSRKRSKLSPDNDNRRRRNRSYESEQLPANSSQNLSSVSYPMEMVGAEFKYDYGGDDHKSTDLTNTASTTPSGPQKIKKSFQEGDLWETLTENDMEPPGGFKAPLPPIITKKKFEPGNKNEKLPIEVKLKTDAQPPPTAELVASYGDSDSDEEEAGDEHLVDTTKLVCLLCKRAFMNQQTLKKHQSQSQLHKENLAEYKKKLVGSAIINTNPLKKL